MPIFLLYLLITVIVFISHLSGIHTFFTSGDAAVQSYAWLAKIEHAILNFDFPLWDFSTDSGTSFIGELQTGAFYPPVWMMSLLPPYGKYEKFELFIALHFTWGAFGAFTLFRQFGLSKISAFLGGLLFGFVGPAAARAFAQPNLHAGVVQIPWMVYFALLGARSNLAKETLKNFACCAGIGALAILAGHMHGFIHGVVASALIVPLISRDSWKKLIYFIPVFPFALSLAAVQFLPTYEYFQLAYKWFGTGFTKYPHVVPFAEFERFALKSTCSFNLGIPNCQSPEGASLFFTFSGYLLAILGIAYIVREHKKLVNYYFLALLVVALILATGGNNFWGELIYKTPILNIVRIPSRAMHLYSLATAGLIAFGVQLLISNYKSYQLKLILRSAGLLLIVVLSFEVFKYTERYHQPATTIDAGPTYYKLNPIFQFLIDQNTTEQGLYRFANQPNSIIPANIGNVYPLKNITSHKSSKYGKYYDYLSKDWNYLSTRFNELGLKYIVTNKEIPELKKVKEYQGIMVYEKTNPLTIFYYKKNKKFIPIPLDSRLTWNENSVTITFPKNFKSPIGGRFVFAQAHYPGWKVFVNQEQRPILNKPTLITIKNNLKIKKITYRYQPVSVMVGFVITFASFISLLLLIISNRKNES